MASLKDACEMILLRYAKHWITAEQCVVLNEFNESEHLDLTYHLYPEFDLESMEDSECISEFRFRKQDLSLLEDVLEIRPQFTCQQRSECDGMEGLCMPLKRLAYPCCYADIIHRFTRPVPVICMVTNTVLDHIYDRFAHKGKGIPPKV